MVIAGHRGAAAVAPENTLPAFQKAWEAGARMVELDVRLSRDGKPVIFHDDRLDRITPERGLVSERDYEELIRIPVMPGAFGGAFPNARIPLLSQAMASIPEDTTVLVELKPESKRAQELVDHSLEAIGRHVRRCRFISFDHNLLRLLRQSRPGEGPMGALRDGSKLRLGVLTNARDRAKLIEVGREVKAEALHAPHGSIDAEWRAAAREAGFLVNAWTVNTEADWKRLADLGVEEITTDNPERALAYFRKK